MKKNHSLKIFGKLLVSSICLIANTSWAQWVNVSTGYSNVELFDVKFTDDNTGIAVGRDHTTEIGYVFKTSNGGASWITFTTANTFFRATAFSSSIAANAGGYPTVPSSSTVLYETFTAGTNWGLILQLPQPLPYTGIEHMQFLNGQDGFASGYGTQFGNSIGIYKTTNSGATWTGVNSINGTLGGPFHMISPTTGYLTTYAGLSSGTIRKTTNGGVSFTTCYTGNWMKDVTFLNANLGFGLEGLISSSCIATTNGGASWTTLGTVGTANAFIFSNSSHGWTVGGSGNIYMTSNGGVTWTTENSTTTENLNEISLSPGYAWACGDQGMVLKRVRPAAPAPVASFSFVAGFCTNTAKSFSDQTTNSPDSWSWSITPSVGVSINPSPSAQNPLITFGNPGTYTVMLTAANGTLVGQAYSTTVLVNSSPQLTVSASQNTSCVNETLTLSVSGAGSYSWTGVVLNNTLASTAVNTGTITGPRNFSVSGKTAQGCSSEAVITIVINACTGMEENQIPTEITIYPNPFNTYFNMNGQTGTLEIYNSIGQFVKRVHVEQATQVDMAAWPGGMYFLKFYQAGSGKPSSARLIKD